MIRRVALYARVSTRDKDQNPEVQFVPLRTYAQGHGWQVTEYVDQAPAGDLRHRNAWRSLLADARHRRVDAIVVLRLDRAFRSSVDAHATLASLEHHGVGFVSITQAFDTTSPTGRLVFAILAAVAEMERSLIAERVKEGMRLAASRGAHVGRPTVTGRRKVARDWPQLRDLVLQGSISQRQAARQLGIGATTVRRLLAAQK